MHRQDIDGFGIRTQPTGYQRRSAVWVPRMADSNSGGEASLKGTALSPHKATKRRWLHVKARVSKVYNLLPQPIRRFLYICKRLRLEFPAISMILLGMLMPIFHSYVETYGYNLTAARSLLGSVPSELKPDLNFDASQSAYVFKQKQQAPPNSLQLGGLTYSAVLPTNATKGIALTDTQKNLSITLTPEFDLSTGKQEDYHIVYPIVGSLGQVVYTPKDNGMKEDIVLYGSPGATARFAYKLQVPNGLVAKLQSDGSVGIFGGDPELYGNISYGSSSDQALVAKARQNSAKTHLYYVIPSPVVKGSEGVNASFGLNGNQLTVTVSGLSKAHYPLTIDPTLVMSTTSSWQMGNNEDNIDWSGGNLNRSGLTGGGVGSWSNNSNLPGNTSGPSLAVYNGRVYLEAGTYNGTGIYSTTISSAGVIGAFTQVATLNNSAADGAMVAYNGWLYAIGGNNSMTLYATVQHARINGDGSLGSFTNTTASLNTARTLFPAAVYNGYIYVFGGCVTATITSCSADTNQTEYGKIQGNGDITSWTIASNTFAGSRMENGGAVINGRAYVFGGFQNSNSTVVTNIQYAPVNPSDGSLGTWQTSTVGMPGAYPEGTTVLINDGYVYILGGSNNSGGTNVATVYYAPIYADGTLGAFNATTSMTNNRSVGAGFVYNNQLFVGGGCSTSCGAGATNDLMSATIDQAGALASSWTTTTQYNGWNCSGYDHVRDGASTTVYNGYIYAVGGFNDCLGINTGENSYEEAPINSDGSLGTWSTPASTGSVSAENFGLVAYDGYMYMLGGCSSSSGGTCGSVVNTWQSAPINSDGTLGSWTTGNNSMNTARGFMNATEYGGYIYVGVGAAANGTSNSTIEYAPVCTAASTPSGCPATGWQGSLGTWVQDNANTITDGNGQYSRLEAWGGTLIYIPGNGGTDIKYATLNSSTGALQSGWQNGTTMNQGLSGMSTAIDNNVLYVIGGNVSGTAQTTVYATALDAYGQPTNAWTTVTSISSATACGDSAANDGYLYLIGISGSCAPNNTAQNNVYISVNAGGAGGASSWTQDTTNTITAVTKAGVAVLNGYIYVVGGCSAGLGTCTANNGNVQYAQINPATGDVGSWTSTTNMPTNSRREATVLAYNGYLYAMGGCSTATTCSTSNVYYVQPSSVNGSIGTWTDQTGAAIPTGTQGTRMATIAGGYIYLASLNSTSVYYATFASSGPGLAAPSSCSGTLSGYWCSTSSLVETNWLGNLVSNGNYLYLVAGYNGGNDGGLHVEYAPINADHSVGAWAYTSFLPQYIQDAVSVGVLDGFVFVAGGYNGTAASAQTAYAPILAGGALGSWQTGASLVTARSDATGVIYDGYMYAVGGNTATSFLNTIEYAPLQVIDRQATYSVLLTTDKNTNPEKLVLTYTPESTLASQVTITYMTAASGASAFGASSSATAGNGSAIPITISGDGVSYYWLDININDEQAAAFGGTPTSITYLNLYYHPNPSMRLRGGQTFNDQSTTGSLDTP